MSLIKMKSSVCLLLFFLLSNSAFLLAQDSIAEAKLDAVKIKIGDQTNLNLRVKIKPGSKLKFPEIKDTINEHIEVVSQSKIDSSFSSDRQQLTLSKKVLITSFDSGFFAIPPFLFIVDDDSLHPLNTEPLLIHVQTVSVDTTKAIRDIKGPKDAPWNIKEIVPYLIGGGILLLLAIIIIYYLRKRKKQPDIIVEPKVVIPPHIIALEQLQQLKNEKLWQEGKFKLYQIRLADIVRTYFEARFQIVAMEQTTDETMRSLRSMQLPEELRLQLRGLLVLSDMVKFAKEQPLPAENEKSMDDAIRFVETTANSYSFAEKKEGQQ